LRSGRSASPLGDDRPQRAVGLVEVSERPVVHEHGDGGGGKVDDVNRLAGNGNEGGHLAGACLEELVGVEGTVDARDSEPGCVGRHAEIAKSRLEPRAAVVETDPRSCSQDMGEGDTADLDVPAWVRPLGEQGLQGRDGGLGLLEPLVHALEVDEDRPVSSGDVGRLQHLSHLVDRHVEVADPSDRLRRRHQARGVTAVAGDLVDERGIEQPDVVIVPQRLHAQVVIFENAPIVRNTSTGASIASLSQRAGDRRGALDHHPVDHGRDVVGQHVGGPNPPAASRPLDSVEHLD